MWYPAIIVQDSSVAISVSSIVARDLDARQQFGASPRYILPLALPPIRQNAKRHYYCSPVCVDVFAGPSLKTTADRSSLWDGSPEGLTFAATCPPPWLRGNRLRGLRALLFVTALALCPWTSAAAHYEATAPAEERTATENSGSFPVLSARKSAASTLEVPSTRLSAQSRMDRRSPNRHLQMRQVSAPTVTQIRTRRSERLKCQAM